MLRRELFSKEELAEFEEFMKMAIEEAVSAKAAGMVKAVDDFLGGGRW